MSPFSSLSALVLTFWTLPMLLTAFVPLSYREILAGFREALVIAVVTSLSVAALPLIQDAVQKFTGRIKAGETDSRQTTEIIETSLSVSYPLAQIGNFFILVFLFYAAYYYYIPLDRLQILEIPFVTLLSGVGSPTSSIGAVTFMADWLGLPGRTTDLYVETMSITRYAQVITSVAAFGFVTTIVVFMFYGKVRFNPRAFVLTLAVTAAAFSGIWMFGRWGGDHVALHSAPTYMTASLPQAVQSYSDANLASPPPVGNDTKKHPGQTDPDPGPRGLKSIQRIETTGVLRVGVNPNVMPFSYENARGELIGFDLEMIYRFAQSMDVKLVFRTYDWKTLVDDLKAGKFDIAIGGLYITDDRLEDLDVSRPYFESPLALIVRTSRLQDFRSRRSISKLDNPTIAVFDDPVLINLTRREFPNASLKIVQNYDQLENWRDADAAIWTWEQARALAISMKGYSAVVPYSVVVPSDNANRFLFAYLMPPDSPGLLTYFNYWLDLLKDSGVLEDMTRRWINPASTGPAD
ncbi:ABC transporter substrate-binding protein [Roseibium sp. RKSG952]|uniref:ABC transporter substrate-binding protein n=1 Tax=Roseibium sp. RKSG952 TaxID=2529384 RepID=UPI0012BD3F25|nr:ABC transporter substrate-binding protein [Roseibium sp. RKSG952]MTH98120.1 amino acid ABC transporter substrate-binding protein [Roseibium sp. RKSG952]